MSGRTAELWVLVCTNAENFTLLHRLQMASQAPDNSMSFSSFTFVHGNGIPHPCLFMPVAIYFMTHGN